MSGFRIFTLAGVPVHVTAWYFLILLFWLRGGLESALVWGGAITVSILVHEFGHAMVARHFRLNPSIELHGWGGLCHHERAASDRHDALILIAGPGAGLALGVLVFGAQLFVDPMWMMQHRMLAAFTQYMLYVNLIWSLVNLVPLWPLDGGQLFRLGLMRLFTPAKAERITHVVGTLLGIAACFVAFTLMDSRFLAIIAAFLTWQNIQRMNDSSASGPIRSQNRHAQEVLKQARQAYADRDWPTAERLAHQAKAESVIDPRVVAEIFEILGVASAALGRFEVAWSYLVRAPMRGQVYLAKVECVLALGLAAEAPALLQYKDASQLPHDVRSDLERLSHGMPLSN